MPVQKLARAFSSLRSDGISGSCRKLQRRMRIKRGQAENKLKVLLITNRDSDNVGDQVIEECARSLVATALNELGVESFQITSRAAGMISKRYLGTRDEKLLEEPERAIATADVVVFGGAPLFNYRYQPFYERTAITLEMAERHQVPVIFSAIGIEGYDADDPKCQRLQKALSLPCVQQITTRDNFDALQKLTEHANVTVAKVADSAVFANQVFFRFIAQKTDKVGLFVIREHAFRDNGINFTKQEAAQFWVSIIDELQSRGIDYELITSGHFSDEAFMELLITDYSVPASKCVFNVNAPEDLIEKISSYRAIVSCRLHPSIIAYSLNVPSVGLIWNEKVPHFYESVGYGQRAIYPQTAQAFTVVNLLQQAINEGVRHDEDYRLSTYTTLRDGLAQALGLMMPPESPSAASLAERITIFPGTTEEERQAKLERKFRRTYDKFNIVASQNNKLKRRNARLQEKLEHATEQ